MATQNFMPPALENFDPDAVVRIHDGAVFVARRVAGISKFKIAALLCVGAFHDSIPGISHVFEHLSLERTPRFPGKQLERFFVDRGGYANAAVDYDNTVFHSNVLKEHFRDGISGIAAMIGTPVLDQAGLANEKPLITAECATIEMIAQEHRARQFLAATLGKNVPPPITGTPESVASIRLADLEVFCRRHHTMDNLIVYMEGDLDPQEMLDEAARRFSLPRGTRNQPGPPLPFCPATISQSLPHLAATHAAILFPFHPYGSGEAVWAAANLCNDMMAGYDGSLMHELRDTQRLVYKIDTGVTCNSRVAIRSVEFDAYPEKVRTIGEIAMRHIAELAVTPDEAVFDRFKKSAVTSIAEYLERNNETSPRSIVGDIQSTHKVPGRRQYLDALKAVTVDDVARYAARYLASGPVSVCYEGSVRPDFPDHTALMAYRPPLRVPSTDSHVTAAGRAATTAAAVG